MMMKIAKNSILKYYNKLGFFRYILGGFFLTLSLPPFYIFPLGILAVFIFYKIAFEKQKPYLKALLFGFGFFVSSLYWIKNSILIAGLNFYWLIPFALIGIPCFLALFFVLKIFIFIYLKQTNEIFNLCLFAFIWVLVELLRGFIFGGFPWSLIGYTFLFNKTLSQLAYLINVYGLGFLFVFLSVLIFSKIKYKYYIVFILISIQAIFGLYHLNKSQNTAIESVKGINFYVVQPNIKQEMKISVSKHYENTQKIINQLKQVQVKENSIVILPEAVFPYILRFEEDFRKDLAKTLNKNSYLVLGSTTLNDDNSKIFNSIEVLDEKGEIQAAYNKVKLVPFGEFVPFRKIFPFINKITPGEGDFSSGDAIKSIYLQRFNVKFSPLICYEIIFPKQVVDKKNRPNFIITVSNDAWFSDTIGPKQHLAFARMRAIEEGMFVFRSANTGISAIIDSNGSIMNKIDYNSLGFIKLDAF